VDGGNSCRRGILVRSANILTPPPANRGKFIRPVAQALRPEAFHGPTAKSVGTSPPLPVICSVLFLCLSLLCAGDLSAQTKKKKEETRASESSGVRDRLQTGHDLSDSRFLDSGRRCRAKRTRPAGARPPSAAHPAPTKNSPLSRTEIFPAYGANELLSRLAMTTIRRATRSMALNWLQKAKADTLLYEYTLFWTAQSERALGKKRRGCAGLRANPEGASRRSFQGTGS